MTIDRKHKRYTITVALIYANGPVHIGHVAGCCLPADIYARYLRLQNAEVCFVGGTDEHGIPITLQARRENCTPQAVVDKYYPQIKTSLEAIGISFDVFGRTSSALHYQKSTDFFLTLHQKNCFVQKSSEQYYDEEKKIFLADRYIYGKCPGCSYERAYGDQCESCGRSLSPKELLEPTSVFGGKMSRKETKNWYLPMDKWQHLMEEYIRSRRDWKPTVVSQCESWLKEGLRARAMTRDLDWGVPVPLRETAHKVLYVWFDAPIGYISFTEELLSDQWKKFWQQEDTKLVHFIGKDNIVFHCIIFPLMLKLHGNYIVPDQVPANEFLNLEGEKISTSRNWAVWLHEYVEEFPEQADVLRYVLCAHMPETKDSDFTWKEFQSRNNNELVAILGNFFHRIIHLTHTYSSGRVPKVDPRASDQKILHQANQLIQQVAEHIEKFSFRKALTAAMDVARLGNKYMTDEAPWRKELSSVTRKAQLYTSLQIAAKISIIIEPFLPFTAKKMQSLLSLKENTWSHTLRTPLVAEQPIAKPILLFKKIEHAVIEKQIEKLSRQKKGADTMDKTSESTIDKQIDFQDFTKVDIRIGTVLECTKVPQSNKLLQFVLDDGEAHRTILSGIAQYYDPETLVGEQVVFVKNLAPRKILGILSEGMILSASSDTELRLLRPDELIDTGAKVS